MADFYAVVDTVKYPVSLSRLELSSFSLRKNIHHCLALIIHVYIIYSLYQQSLNSFVLDFLWFYKFKGTF